jgi:hypothetical protein
MRDLPAILEDIKQYLSSHGLTEDLQSLQDEIKVSTIAGKLYSHVGTWLLTFQVYSDCDQTVYDLINEYIQCCHFNGIYPI